jgi:hypothetical protein
MLQSPRCEEYPVSGVPAPRLNHPHASAVRVRKAAKSPEIKYRTIRAEEHLQVKLEE